MLNKIKKKYQIDILIVGLLSLLFSFWLMFATFSYKDGSMLISAKAWSDFSGNIPLIRSFSLGDNFPPQYPLFPGEPIRYHYLFYFLVGTLEKVGLRIDWALNLPSALSFSALMLLIYLLGKELFKDKAVGILSVIFFLFNSSLSSIEFFKLHPVSISTFKDIITNSVFSSFGPYDGKVVSAFWNLNIYTNQRHLALALSIFLLIVFFILKYERKKNNLPIRLIMLFGILVGVMPLLHSSMFLMMFIVLGILFILFKFQRKSLFLILLIGFLISLPRVLFLKETTTYIPHLQIGYLANNPTSIINFLYYWIMNLGLSFFLIPIGFILSPKLAKKVLIAFLSLFLIGNLFQFSSEMAGNHKFFNAFIIVGNMFMAFLLVKLWRIFKYLRVVVLMAGFFLIFSGLIDFFPIKNDGLIAIADYPKNADVKWITKNTPKNSVFLNTTYIYNPASIAGRKIFFGWPYFSWSLGYDTDTRGKLTERILAEPDKNTACKLLKENSLDYLEINTNHSDFPIISDLYSQQFNLAYRNSLTGYSVYNVEKSCK
jgi:hypothetical protein